jgi:hypothetical protein
MQISVSLLLTMAGGVLYTILPSKAAELARIVFFVGLFWLTYALGRSSLHFG